MKLISSFQRDVPVCVFAGDVALASAVRFLDLNHWVAEGWKHVSGAASHKRKDCGVRGLTWWLRGGALLKKCVTSDTM